MLENSDQLLDGSDEIKVNWQLLKKAPELRGYLVHCIVVDTG